MRFLNNEKGIALMMALILSLIALAIISALIYFVTQGTIISGYQKRYQTAQEAAKGGVELITKEVIPQTIVSIDVSDLTNRINSLQNDYSGISLAFTTGAPCLRDKLLLSTIDWSNCSAANKTLDPKNSPDLIFQLSGIPPAQPFNVFAKTVDTIGGLYANSDTSGLELEGLGVTESGSGMVSPKHNPFIYRIEVQAERSTNPDERANFSILYAY
ncbi:MAG: pilus assembly PilX N-terminal domain-containing protein [Thermodesulfovibrionales bacterium]